VVPVVVALFGPTSSGKTRLSIDLGRRIWQELGVEPVVISADSRQVYKYMDVGTSKTTRAEMRGLRHEMIDVAEPVRKVELEEYVARARRYLANALAAGKLPLVVGGTGIYVASLLQGWHVEGSSTVRAGLRRGFPRAAAAVAHGLLRRLDPASAGRVHPHNYEATIGALAALISQRGPDAERRDCREVRPAGTVDVRHVVLGLDPGVRALDRRIAQTLDRQLERGLLDEVISLDARYGLERELRRRGADSPNQVLHTHGYREFFEVALERGKSVRSLAVHDVAEVRERVVRRIWSYSRRQRGWFEKLPHVSMISTVEQAYDHVRR
jgi:tRNA dimethylallyltransferase